MASGTINTHTVTPAIPSGSSQPRSYSRSQPTIGSHRASPDLPEPAVAVPASEGAITLLRLRTSRPGRDYPRRMTARTGGLPPSIASSVPVPLIRCG